MVFFGSFFKWWGNETFWLDLVNVLLVHQSKSIEQVNMNWNRKEYRKQKHQFKGGSYCIDCQQKRSCGLLDEKKNYCCVCYRKILEELEWDRLLIDSAQLVLNDYRQRVIICQCLGSEKVRVNYINSDGSGWTECERCERLIDSAGHHRVIKNRNDPRFWGLESKWRVLCLECLRRFREEMPTGKRYTLNKYLKRGYK